MNIKHAQTKSWRKESATDAFYALFKSKSLLPSLDIYLFALTRKNNPGFSMCVWRERNSQNQQLSNLHMHIICLITEKNVQLLQNCIYAFTHFLIKTIMDHIIRKQFPKCISDLLYLFWNTHKNSVPFTVNMLHIWYTET